MGSVALDGPADPANPAVAFDSVALDSPGDPGALFRAELIRQVRAGAWYGRLDHLDEGRLLGPYLIDPADPDAVALPCVADPAAVERLRAFFRAVAGRVEHETGHLTGCAVDLDAEGFGRAVLFVGRLVVLCEILRDVNAFGFRGAGQLAARGAELVQAAVRAAGSHPEVAREQP